MSLRLELFFHRLCTKTNTVFKSPFSPCLSFTSFNYPEGFNSLFLVWKISKIYIEREHWCRLRLKCDGTRAENRFRLSAKRTSPFKSAGASVQSTTGSWGVRISGSNAGYTMFRGSVKSTGYTLHSLVSPSLPLPCVTVCHHTYTGF